MNKVIKKIKNEETFEFKKMDFEKVWNGLTTLDYEKDNIHILRFKDVIIPLEEIMYIRKKEEE